MAEAKINEENNTGLSENKELWLSEIIRETEHYVQGEIQHEQRASWILATAGVLIAIIVSIRLTIPNPVPISLSILMILSILSLTLSGVTAIIVIVPLRGTRLRRNLFGKSYKLNQKINIDQLIEMRFRHGENWSIDDYEKRIQYHYRSHFLRTNIKEFWVVWASIFLLLGFILFASVGVIFFS